MSLDQVAREVMVFDCARAILEGQERITVSWAPGARPQGFPLGELLSVGTNGSRNYAVSPVRVLEWIHGRIVAERLAADAARFQRQVDQLSASLIGPSGSA